MDWKLQNNHKKRSISRTKVLSKSVSWNLGKFNVFFLTLFMTIEAYARFGITSLLLCKAKRLQKVSDKA